MKNLIYVIIIAAILFSCNESRIKIIPNYDLQYYSEKTVKTPAIPKDSTLGDKLNKKIVDLLKSYSQDNNKKRQGLSVNWRFYINMDGKIKYIKDLGNKYNPKIMENQESTLSRTILKQLLPEIEKLEFKPAILFDNYVNSSIDLTGMFAFTSQGTVEIYRPIKFNTKGNLFADYFVTVEQMPSPIGGIAAIQKNIHYPEIAKRAGVEGRVFVKAYIDSTGTVVKTELFRGIGSGCDKEAMNAVKRVKFNPGIQRGKRVNVQVTVPILFKLSNGTDNNSSKIVGEWEGKADNGEIIKITFFNNGSSELYKSKSGRMNGKIIPALFNTKYKIDFNKNPHPLDLFIKSKGFMKLIVKFNNDNEIIIGIPKDFNKRPKSFDKKDLSSIWELKKIN